MNYLRLKFNSCPLILLFVWCLFLSMHSERAAAQSVSFSDVCASEDCGVEASAEMAVNGTEIDTYSSVENFFDEDVDSVAVAGDLYDNTSGTLLQSGYDEEEDYAEVDLSTSINTPHEYELGTGISFCVEEDEGEGEGNCSYEEGPYFTLVIDTDYPTVSSIYPTSITVGTSGTITVNGQNFIDQFGDYPVPFINNSGVTLSLSSVSETQASVNYSVESNASTGDFGLNLKGLFGNGEPATLAVGDPTPVVTGISPSVWYAGNSYTVTITGTNFGTSPTSSISAAPGVTYTQTAGSDTSITASVTVAPNAPNTDPISVTVTSQGFGGGSGFFSGNGQSPTTSTTAQSVAVTPAPQFTFGGQNISGATQSVMAGQQIALSVPTPNGYTIQSQSWSFSNQSAITGGFVNGDCTVETQPSAAAGGCEAGDPLLNQNALTFYWVNPGDNGETVTYTYTLNNGQSASATATFNVGGPTGNLLPSAFAQNNNTGTSLSNAQSPAALLSMANSPVKNGVGVFINDNAQPVSNNAQCPSHPGMPPTGGCGQFIWVQILTSVTQLQIIPAGDTFAPSNAVNQLDGTYPYFNGPNNANGTWDSPSRGLLHEWGEGAEPFNATMYVLWDPALPAGCTPAWTDTTTTPYTNHPSTCASTPIPLGSVQWKWSACAINAGVSASPSWFLQCGIGSGTTGGSTNGYPQWDPGTGPGGCHVTSLGPCQ
jgi:hypothetical protein